MSSFRADQRGEVALWKPAKRTWHQVAILVMAFAQLFVASGCSGGGANQQPAAKPTLTPGSGSYSSSQAVTVGDTTPGALLYCTLDGSTPTSSSAQCTEPITVAKSATLSAVAIAPGSTPSAVATATYTIDLPQAAPPVFSPAPGTYTTDQSVSVSDSISGALIYYTTDGSVPTTSSTHYTVPVPITATENINAIAVATGYNDSAVASGAYTIHLPAPTPIISTSTGTTNTIFGTPLMVTIADADANATIYYAIGSTPGTNTTKYTGPISVSSAETINAIAVDSVGGYSQSAQTTAAFTVTEAMPKFSQNPGTISYGTQISISDLDPAATIYYTIGSAPPTTSSTVYAGPITVSSSETINAIAVDAAAKLQQSAPATASYTIPNPTPLPVIASASGLSTTYPSSVSVSITDTDLSATIYYTTDGSAPSATHGSQYSVPIAVSQTETISAVAIDVAEGAPPSPVAAQLFTVIEATPAILPASGAIAQGTKITMTDADPGAAIYYTTNGSPATTSSTRYAAAITLNAAETINAIAIDTKPGTNYTQSLEASAAYTLQTPVPAPVIASASGFSTTYPAALSVSISDSDATAMIYYTIDGSTPNPTHGTKYNAPFVVNSTETVTAIATDTSHGYSNSVTAVQLCTVVEATPMISPPAGTVTVGAKITITDADPGATIYYSTNGSPASTSSTRYAAAITLNAAETIDAIAIDTNPSTIYAQSQDASALYTLATSAPAPIIGSAGGFSTTYPATLSVSISDSDATATIYYTTDGSTPSPTHGTVYSSAFIVNSTETVSAIATDSSHGYSNSVTVAQLCTVVEAAPMISPPAGTVAIGTKISISDADNSATIYYSTNGGPATTSSTRYAGTITLNAAETINSIAIDTNPGSIYTQSQDSSAAYTLPASVPTPTIVSAGGTSATYPSTLSVTITDSDTNALIYYTADGSTPSATHGTQYSNALTVSSTETITAIAIDTPSGSANSSLASQLLTIVEATPTFSPAAGLISSGTPVIINDADPGATIYYTTNGSTASISSTQYTGPIAVPSSETINAVAVDTTAGTSYTQSQDASAAFVLYSGHTISGNVMSGSLPISGATIVLYAAGTSGYGKSAMAVTTVPASLTTGASGGFSLGYTCPAAPGDQLYLVATGGTTTPAGPSEPGIALMVTLGTCSKLLDSTSVTINEVTTIASAYSLAGFATADSSAAGIVVGAPAPNTTCASGGNSTSGNSTCNYRGLVNAFRTVTNLVNTATGTPLTVTEFYSGSDPNNLNGFSSTYGDPSSVCPGTTCLSPNNTVPEPTLNTSSVPYQRLNTLGDVLASCAEAAGNCTALAGLTGASTDTLQSALYIAQHPGAWSGTNGLYGLIASPAVPYSPPYGNASTTLSAEPNDWTLSISFTGAGLGIDQNADAVDYLTNQGLVIDSNGNVWVGASALDTNTAGVNPTGEAAGLIAGFDPIGEALTPPTTLVADAIAYDSATGYSTYGGYGPDVSSRNLPPGTVGIFGQPNSIVVDSAQHLWVSNNPDAYDPGGSELTISKTASPGAAHILSLSSISPTFDLPDDGSSMAVDSANNLWQSAGIATLWEYNSSGALLNIIPLTLTSPDSGNVQSVCNFSFDTTGTLWADDCATPGGGGEVFALADSSGTMLAAYSDALTESSQIGTLAAGSNGNVYACNTAGTMYFVLDTSNLTAPANTFSTPNGRCGIFLTVDGAGQVWSYGYAPTGPVLDEVKGNGTQITPDNGLTGTSNDEIAATGLTTFNQSAVDGQGGIAVDESGNLWFLNGVAGAVLPTATPANALVEFIGLAAPTVTPTSVATQNGAQGTMP